MTTQAYVPIDGAMPPQPAELFDDAPVLARYPRLREFSERLGNTSLIEVPGPAGGARILGKCEFENPAGSVKDRPAYGMLCRAVLDHGDDPRPLQLLDYSGGSLVRAFAALHKLTGIPMRFAVPASIPDTWRRIVEESGVQIDLVDPATGIMGTVDRATHLSWENPDWTMLHQIRNPANLLMHEHTTGREIVEQLDRRRPACWVAAVGTGGTLAGVGRALRRAFPEVRIVGNTPREMPFGTADQPNGRPKFAGSGGLGHGIRQPMVSGFVPDALHETTSYDEVLAGMVRFEQLTGRRIGTSAAANWLVAWTQAEKLTPDDLVVTLFADAGAPEEWQRAYDHRRAAAASGG
jgi:cysteine synthase A